MSEWHKPNPFDESDGRGWNWGYFRPRRSVVRNWERLVGAAVRANPERSEEVAGFDPTAASTAEKVRFVLEAAQDVENDDIRVARILCEYAFLLSQELDPSDPGRRVLQFRACLKAVLTQNHYKSLPVYRGKDVDTMREYYEMFKEKDIDYLIAEEQAAPEGNQNPE